MGMNRILATILTLFLAFCSYADEASKKVEYNAPIQMAPAFPGGVSARTKFLQDNIQYPAECAMAGIDGIVMVKYMVKSDGTLAEIQVAQSSGNELLDNEALRVVKLFPDHTPGKLRGETVDSYLTLPVSFRLK